MNKSEYIALKARIGYELQNLDIIEKALEKEGLFPKLVSNSISGLEFCLYHSQCHGDESC